MIIGNCTEYTRDPDSHPDLGNSQHHIVFILLGVSEIHSDVKTVQKGDFQSINIINTRICMRIVNFIISGCRTESAFFLHPKSVFS